LCAACDRTRPDVSKAIAARFRRSRIYQRPLFTTEYSNRLQTALTKHDAAPMTLERCDGLDTVAMVMLKDFRGK
jgi:hypothetical protein